MKGFWKLVESQTYFKSAPHTQSKCLASERKMSFWFAHESPDCCCSDAERNNLKNIERYKKLQILPETEKNKIYESTKIKFVIISMFSVFLLPCLNIPCCRAIYTRNYCVREWLQRKTIFYPIIENYQKTASNSF